MCISTIIYYVLAQVTSISSDRPNKAEISLKVALNIITLNTCVLHYYYKYKVIIKDFIYMEVRLDI